MDPGYLPTQHAVPSGPVLVLHYLSTVERSEKTNTSQALSLTGCLKDRLCEQPEGPAGCGESHVEPEGGTRKAEKKQVELAFRVPESPQAQGTCSWSSNKCSDGWRGLGSPQDPLWEAPGKYHHHDIHSFRQ
eukprot:XP_016883686.1 uncharacterized protein LOC105372714 isoform X3 [Homo sapiens]